MAGRKRKPPMETVELAWAFEFVCPHCSQNNFLDSIFMEDETKVGKIVIPEYVACGGCNKKLKTGYPPGLAEGQMKNEE